MNTLYLAWQDRLGSRAWFPVGLLEVNPGRSGYEFAYTRGAQQAKDSVGFQPFPSFPELSRRYISQELFPLFTNRLLGRSREEFSRYIKWLGLSTDNPDPMEILAVTGGERQTDSIEIFPKINALPDGSFQCRFFLHGLRHAAKHAQDRAQALRKGEPLRIAIEVNNPATGFAVQLQSDDYVMLGWLPRYLVEDIKRAAVDTADVTATVVRVNLPPAPRSKQFLIELSGRLPKDFSPMNSDEFQPLG